MHGLYQSLVYDAQIFICVACDIPLVWYYLCMRWINELSWGKIRRQKEFFKRFFKRCYAATMITVQCFALYFWPKSSVLDASLKPISHFTMMFSQSSTPLTDPSLWSPSLPHLIIIMVNQNTNRSQPCVVCALPI